MTGAMILSGLPFLIEFDPAIQAIIMDSQATPK